MNPDPDPDQGAEPMQIYADPVLVSLCRHKKLNLYMKNILYVGNRS